MLFFGCLRWFRVGSSTNLKYSETKWMLLQSIVVGHFLLSKTQNNMKKTALMLSALVLSAAAFANSPVPVSNLDPDKVAIVKGGDSMKLVYTKEDQSQVMIKLLDQKGKEILSKKVKSEEGFIQPFNFKNLDEGTYTFEITDDDGTVKEEVNYTRYIARKNAISSVYQITGTSKYKVSLESDGNPVMVEIKDSKGNVVHKEKIDAESSFSRTYDLSAISAQDLQFEITSGKQTDYHIK